MKKLRLVLVGAVMIAGCATQGPQGQAALLQSSEATLAKLKEVEGTWERTFFPTARMVIPEVTGEGTIRIQWTFYGGMSVRDALLKMVDGRPHLSFQGATGARFDLELRDGTFVGSSSNTFSINPQRFHRQ